MSRDGEKNFLASIGFVLFGGVLIIGILIAILYIFPSATIFGVSAVSEKQAYTTYYGSAFEDAMSSRNIIIESKNTPIEVWLRKEYQESTNPEEDIVQPTITVFEDASGLAINSPDRTLIEVRQVIVDKQNNIFDPSEGIRGAVFYKIKINEPTGAVRRNAKVYLNMIKASVEEDEGEIHSFNKYNFILNTGASSVSFFSDPVDPAASELDKTIYVDTLEVNGGGKISLPTKTTTGMAFQMEVDELLVNGSGNSIDARLDVQKRVKVVGSDNKIDAANIGSPTQSERHIAIDLAGGNNSLSFDDCFGHVNIDSTSGTIKGRSALNTTVKTRDANITITTVNGFFDMTSTSGSATIETVQTDFDMTTQNGRADITSARGSLTFNASGNGSLTARHIAGTTDITTNKGYITLGGGSGALKGVFGNTTVNTVSGAVDITFGEFAEADPRPTTVVNAGDGNVKLVGVCGDTEVNMPAGTKGSVSAYIKEVAENSDEPSIRITLLGAYEPTNTYHTVKLYLMNGVNPFWLQVSRSSSAFDYRTNPAQYLENYYGDKNTGRHSIGGATASTFNIIQVSTATVFELRNA
ncbi:MAG: DUF4097 domain-containing protein [Christensenellaceae bacterium]|jgi:hypothetical protein|nr:DUF4097 domain-containing protein [Christensenellaceae bacterium]